MAAVTTNLNVLIRNLAEHSFLGICKRSGNQSSKSACPATQGTSRLRRITNELAVIGAVALAGEMGPYAAPTMVSLKGEYTQLWLQ